jgi:hypothetical protein
MAKRLPITIVETPEFLSASRKLLTDEQRADLVDYLARNPEQGDLIPESGGVRKLRWALEGRGKRGGARVIYFFHSQRLPVFLLTAYAKNQRDNLSALDLMGFRALTKSIADTYAAQRKKTKGTLQ